MAREKCPFANEDCRYWEKRPVVRGEPSGCYSDDHHLYWPSPEYRTKNEKAFRESKENHLQTCRQLHDEIHLYEAPEKYTPRQEILDMIGEVATDMGFSV